MDGTSISRPIYYERLCLDPYTNPSNELIEEHCRELLRWWQKKLPLKNQPSNPITQLLRPGLDESSRYLTEARVELLDPERRRELDEDTGRASARASDRGISTNILAFALTDGVLTAEEERSLSAIRRRTRPQIGGDDALMEAELQKKGARRAPQVSRAAHSVKRRIERCANDLSIHEDDFMRMLASAGWTAMR